jgi:hypothetical protein
MRPQNQAGAPIRQLEIDRYWSDQMEKPRYADPRSLLRHGFKVYSQADEDGIVQEIFKRIGMTNRTFVEFGVESGIECSTVKLLIEGWNGLWIEMAADHVQAIKRVFADFIAENRLRLRQSKVTTENINGLIADAGLAGEIDLLSVDVDGNDYWVWQAISQVRPRVVVVEYNATLRPPMSLVVPYDPDWAWDATNYYGASLEALTRLGRKKGYRLVGCSFSGVNAFFVRDDLCADKFLEPATAEMHYEPPRYYFQPSAGHRPGPGRYVSIEE